MKKYEFKYCRSLFLQFMSILTGIIGWCWLSVMVLQKLNLPSIPEAENNVYTAILLTSLLVVFGIIPTVLIIFVLIRLPNARATAEISDTAVKIQKKNKGYDLDIQEISKITYSEKVAFKLSDQLRAHVLCIHFHDSKKIKLRAPGGTKEYKIFRLFYTDLIEKFNQHS